MWDLLLTHGVVITIDKNHTEFNDGFVAVQGERICAIGHMSELPQDYSAKKQIDCSGHVIMPGLVDAHGHAGHSLIRSLGDGKPDWEDLAETIYYECTDSEFWRAEGALAASERLKFGTTTGVSMIGSTPRSELLEPLASHFEGAVSTGIRELAGIGSPYGAFPKHAKWWNGQTLLREYDVAPEMAYATTEQSVKELNGIHSRQICIVVPGRMGHRPDESIEANIEHNRKMFEIASKYGVPLHTHAYEDDVEFMHRYTPEVLTPMLSLTHSTGYSDEAINILASTGAWVFHGPSTNMHTKGHCPVYEMLKRGVNVAIVSDGSASSRSYDLWRDVKNTLLLQRFEHRNTGILSCGKVLEMVTIEPARALGLDKEIGSLEVGKKADIITIDYRQPHLFPFQMPVTRLVNHAMGQDVDNVIVEGEIVLHNRHFTLFDEAKMLDQAKDAQDQMLWRLNRPDVLINDRLYAL